MPNPLVNDRTVEFLLHEVLDLDAVLGLPAFADHSRETVAMYLAGVRRVAREVLYPSYRAMDQEPPVLREGTVRLHPRFGECFRQVVDLGVLAAHRPVAAGGQQLPLLVASLANLYLMAGNLAVYGAVGLTAGAGRLIESFGDAALRARFLARMYAGEWAGTMALTEPQAGSSLSDVVTRATPTPSGHHLLRGSKIFISGGDQDVTENVVHLVLARIDGAPAGIKGVSLFAVPKRREQGGRLVPNDCTTAGVFHKIGWRGLPSIALELGDAGDCHGWLVGEPHRGIGYMFQMMNEARLMVGMNGVATASVAYHEALAYACQRPQGRPVGSRDPRAPQVPIVEHADVRRMLLRQKAIVEGGLALLAHVAWLADHAEHAPDPAARARAARLIDLLTPVAKTFPAEKGFEANALAVQVHGGYGYTSEYPVEAWLRDQKLNSIHEGTSGIQSLDLLGRKAVTDGGSALRELLGAIGRDVEAAGAAGVEAAWGAAVDAGAATVGEVTIQLAALGGAGRLDEMLRHSADYLELFSVVVIGWQWLRLATAAVRGRRRGPDTAFYEGVLCAAQYWMATELPRVGALADLCRGDDDSYARCRPEWF